MGKSRANFKDGMILKRQKPIQFNSPTEVLYDVEDLKKAILWYANGRPVVGLKHVFLYGKYYAVSIYDEKIHVHRLLMMYWLQRDLESDEYVHHINSNKFNNMRENLEVMWASEHQRQTNLGRKQTPDHIAKRTAAMKKTRYENKDLLV